MAGGYGRGAGIPLKDRLRAGEVTEAPSPPGAERPPARHCWVRGPVDGSAPRPGLLLEWAKDLDGRWSGRVVYAAQLRAGRWATVEEWVPAGLLEQAPD